MHSAPRTAIRLRAVLVARRARQKSANRAFCTASAVDAAAMLPRQNGAKIPKEDDQQQRGNAIGTIPYAVAAPSHSPLLDTFGRFHNYLRLSLVEKCNLRCKRLLNLRLLCLRLKNTEIFFENFQIFISIKFAKLWPKNCLHIFRSILHAGGGNNPVVPIQAFVECRGNCPAGAVVCRERRGQSASDGRWTHYTEGSVFFCLILSFLTFTFMPFVLLFNRESVFIFSGQSRHEKNHKIKKVLEFFWNKFIA